MFRLRVMMLLGGLNYNFATLHRATITFATLRRCPVHGPV
jgi:hypothetical protein